MKKNKNLNLWMFSLHFIAYLLIGCSSDSARVDAYITSADEHFLEGDYASAEIEYLNAVELDTEAGYAFGRLGIIYFDQGRPRNAAPYLRRASQLDSDNLEVAYRLALLYLATGDAEAAKEECLQILQKDPHNRHAPVILVNATGKDETIEEIEKTLEEFEANAPDNPSFKVARAIRFARSEQMEEAKQALQEALEIDENSSYAHSTLAKIYASEGDDDKVEAALIAAAKDMPVRSPFRLELIRFYLRGYDKEKGRGLLSEVLEAAPNMVPALSLMARLQKTDDGENEQTLETVQSILELDPVNHDALVMKGALLIELDKSEESAEILSETVKLYPNSHLANYEYARACINTGDLQKASESLSKSVQLKPDFDAALSLLSTVQLRTGDYGQSTENTSKLLESNPDDPYLKVRLAASLVGQGDVEAAIKIYEELEAAYPENPRVPFSKGRVYIRMNDDSNAVAALQESLKRDPDFLPALELLTNYYVSKKQFDKAINRIDSRIQAQPENVALLYALKAKVSLAQGDDESAENLLLKAIELQSDYRAAYAMLVQLYLKNKSPDAALTRLEEMLANNPEDIPVMMIMSGIYEQQSEWERARDVYSKILEINPEFVLALNNLAYLYSTVLDDLDQAEELAQKAHQAVPKDPAIADTLGWIKYLQGDYQMARFLLTESLEQLPDQGEILYHFGSACYMLGDETEARKAFELAMKSEQSFNGKTEISKYLEVLDMDDSDTSNLEILEKIVAENPQDPVALLKLAKVYELSDKNDSAVQFYDKVLEKNSNNVPALIGKARILVASGKNAQALKILGNANAFNPNDPETNGQIGLVAFLAGDYTLSVNLLQKALNNPDRDPKLDYHLAQALLALGRIDAAKDILEQLGDEDAQSLLAFLEKVDSTAQSELNFEEAISLANASKNKLATAWIKALAAKLESNIQGTETFEKLLVEFPDFTPAKKELAIFYAMSGENDERAYNLASEASRSFQDDSELKLALGVLECKRKNFNRALDLLEACNAGDSKIAIVQFYWGVALNKSGKIEQSIVFLKQALELGLPEAEAEEANELIFQAGVE